MGLHIHHGSHLLELVESYASLLAIPLADPFTCEVIAVPTAGVRDWLQQQLALRLGAAGRQDGVAANIEMLFPGRFVGRALGQPANFDDPWDIDHLTWSVLQTLESTKVAVPGYGAAALDPTASTRSSVTHSTDMHPVDRHPAVVRTRYATARRIADLFDRYAVNRPDMLHLWQLGHDGDGTLDEHGAVVPLSQDQQWQPALWREVRSLIAVPSRAEVMPQLLADLCDGRVQPQLPQRVGVFGVSAVAPGQLSVLCALAHVRDVHVYLVHPSAVAWQQCRQQLQGKLTPRSACDATAHVRHRLVRSWARPAMEATALLGGVAVFGVLAEQHQHLHPAHEFTNGAASLLHQMQGDIAADHEPLGSRAHIVDNSVQIHACHGTTRQLEVLRDALGHLFAADATLAPHDVMIVCPDLTRFAPLISSVFQRGTFPVPVQVSDLSLGIENPVATALSALVEFASGRCTASDLLGLCSLAPIQRKLGLSYDDLSRIDQWIVDLGTTWGLDAEHRSEWVPAHVTEGTWASALDRVLLGAAMPCPTPRVGAGGIVPFDDVSADGLRTAGVLAELIAMLRAARRATSGEHTIREWVDALTDLVSSLCATTPDDAWQLAQVLQTIADLRDQSMVAASPCDVPLSISDVRAILDESMGERHGHLSMRSGSVTVTAMVPVRNIPARVVCVLGLDEGALRSSGADGDDLLAWHPCVGERDTRVEGRHLLLDALMAAGEQLIITCDGSDITTNRALPLSVQLIELRDVVAATLTPTSGGGGGGGGTSAETLVLTRHPRQAYAETNFIARTQSPSSLAGQPFGFDDAMLGAAHARRESLTSADRSGGTDASAACDPAGLRVMATLPLLVPDIVSLHQLTESSSRPARTYLIDRLDIRLPSTPEQLTNEIPIEISSLESWRLGTSLLQQYRNTASPEQLAEWHQAQQLNGTLPPLELAKTALAGIDREVETLFAAVPNLAWLIAQSDTLPIDLHLNASGPEPAHVRLVDTLTNIAGDILVRVDFKRPRPRFNIGAALDLAAAVLTQPERDWQALLVTRGTSKNKATALRLVPVAQQRVVAAQALLDIALGLRLQALREPVPLFESASQKLFRSGTFDETPYEKDLGDQHTNFLWGHITADEIMSPAGGGRAQALAEALWGAYDAFTQELSP